MQLRRRSLPLVLGLTIVTALLATACANRVAPSDPISSTARAKIAARTQMPSPTSSVSSPRPGTQEPARSDLAPNFAFVFEYGECGTARVDTFRNRYTAFIGLTKGVPPSTTLTLSGAEKERIHRKMAEIGFFGYPEEFAVDIPPDSGATIFDPAPSYRFKVRNGDLIKELRWSDHISSPTNARADRLRELIRLIERTVQAHHPDERVTVPEDASGGCQ